MDQVKEEERVGQEEAVTEWHDLHFLRNWWMEKNREERAQWSEDRHPKIQSRELASQHKE